MLGLPYENVDNHTSDKDTTDSQIEDDIFSDFIWADWTYEGDKSITEYTIPDGVRVIGDYAFLGCENLVSITIPESVTSIGASAFEFCKRLKSVFIPKNVKEIKTSAFGSCYNLQEFVVDKDNKYFSAINGVLFNYDTTELISSPNQSEYTIPSSVKKIGQYAFQGCYNLTSVTIPNNVETIEEGAFSHCLALTAITISENVKSIGDYAFKECINLKAVTIPQSVKTIGLYAFQECYNLQSLTLENGVESIENGAFLLCTSLKSLTIPESVSEIQGGAFSSCYQLKSIEVDNKNPFFVSVDGVLFSYDKTKLIYCTNRTDYKIPSTTKVIGKYAFQGCNTLKSLTIPNSVEVIEDYGCSICKNLQSIIIPGSIKRIGKYAFWKCNLETIKLENGIEKIGDYAFLDCESLTKITIPHSVKAIGKGAFSNCTKLEKVTINEGVEIIGDYAFKYCRNLHSVVIPKSIKEFGHDVFEKNYMSNYSISYSYSGTSSQILSQIQASKTKVNETISEYNIPSAKRRAVVEGNKYFISIDGVVYTKDTTKLIYFPPAKSYNIDDIPKSVYEIGPDAFKGYSKSKSIKIPDTVKWIHRGAFDEAKIRKLNIPYGVGVVGNIFYRPIDDVQKILDLSNCRKLKEISILGGVQGIYLSGCCNLKKISIPGGVEAVNLFYCRNLKKITIPGSVKLIDYFTFRGCSNLKKIIIENGVEFLEDRAFKDCPNLTSIILPGSIREIGEDAFANLTSISCYDDTSARMKLLLNKCMIDVHRQHNRYDSVQYYVDKSTDILKKHRNDSIDCLSIYTSLADYYRTIGDFAKMKYYCKEGVSKFTGTANTRLNLLFLQLADACLCLHEYEEADSALCAYEAVNSIIRDDHKNELDVAYYSSYSALMERYYFESNHLDQFSNRIFLFRVSHKYGISYEVKINILLDTIRWTGVFRTMGFREYERFEDFKYDSTLLPTLGDCCYKFNKFDEAYLYYSKSFDYEFKELKKKFSYMNMYQRQYYWDEHKTSFDNITKISTKMLGNKDAVEMAYNSLLLSKGLLLASEESLSNTIQNSKDEKLKSDYYKLKYYHTQIDTITNPTERDRLVELAGRLETDLMHRSSQFADVVNYMSVDWQKVRNSLDFPLPTFFLHYDFHLIVFPIPKFFDKLLHLFFRFLLFLISSLHIL